MADLKISQLPVASATTGAELFPVVQGGVTKQIALNAVRHIGSAVFDANGSMAVDTNTLFVDAANNRVGVGTATPTEAVEVSASNVMLKLNAATDSFSQLGYYENGTLKWNVYNDPTTDEYRIGNSTGSKLHLSQSGNLGLGVTPSAWGIGKAIEVGATGNAIWGVQASDMRLLVNAYYDGTNYRYNHTQNSGRYDCGAIHAWFTAPSGTAGNAISFTQIWSMSASGHFLAGTDNSYDIGASGATRPRTVYVGTSAVINDITVGRGAGAEANSTSVGNLALNANTTGGGNTAIGKSALRANTTGQANTGVGNNALFANTTGNANTAIGADVPGSLAESALSTNTTGVRNVAVGNASLGKNTTGGYNTALGVGALYSNTTADQNVGVGNDAGYLITTGVRNTILGQGSDSSANNGNDQTVVGQGLTGKGNDTAFIGGTNGAYNEKNVTTWETTSDARLKTDIADLNADSLALVQAVRLRTFRYRTADEITELPSSAAIATTGSQIGVIAQELQAVLPSCVTENSTGVLSVSTDPLLWHLIAAVQTLSTRLAALEA